ncbi:hypothetical protein MYX82_06205 [Acidobacteria bacterium AH-259-D05]|nr:hypothetical protein [Acidobacteria bacterium AH-259-D05]
MVGFAAAALLGYGIAQIGAGDGVIGSGGSSDRLQGAPYYTDADIREVDFSGLTEDQKKTVLDNINRVYCTCGCGLTLAQCVATDSSCPLTNANIGKIKVEVAKASGG